MNWKVYQIISDVAPLQKGTIFQGRRRFWDQSHVSIHEIIVGGYADWGSDRAYVFWEDVEEIDNELEVEYISGS